MATLRPIIISLMIFGLFSLALLNGGILLALANNSNQTIANSPSVQRYADLLNATLEQYQSVANASEEAIATSPISRIFDNIIFDAIGGIWRSIKTLPTTVFNITTDFIGPVLFSGPFLVVIGVITALLTITIVIAVWKMVFTGEGG